LPGVPTAEEAGIRDFVVESWAGLVAPAGTSHETLMRLQATIASIAAREQTKSRLAAAGSEVVAGTPEQFAATLKADRSRWAGIVKISGAHAE
jgi:tripartite-type tricarboxylate transporter receptor subunit TctC